MSEAKLQSILTDGILSDACPRLLIGGAANLCVQHTRELRHALCGLDRNYLRFAAQGSIGVTRLQHEVAKLSYIRERLILERLQCLLKPLGIHIDFFRMPSSNHTASADSKL